MSDMPSTPPAPAAQGADNDKVLAAVATIPVVGLIIYFTMKDASDLVKFYAKQSNGILILSIIAFVGAFAAIIPYLGWLVSCATTILGFAAFVLWLVLLINALQGTKFRIPVLADLVDQVLK